MTERTHDETRELLGAFAVDAVDTREADEVHAHITTCPECEAEVDAHHEVTAMLANTGGDAPPHLWDRIEAQIVTAAPLAAPAPVGMRVLDELAERRARRSTARSARLLAVAAAVLLIVVLGIQVVRLDNRVGQLQRATPQQQLAIAAAAAIANPAAQQVALDAATSGGTPLAQIAVLPTGTAFLVNSSLPALSGDRTYQLWGLVRHRLISLGLLGANPAAVTFTEGRAGLVTKYAITVERAGGVIQSTHKPVAVSAA